MYTGRRVSHRRAIVATLAFVMSVDWAAAPASADDGLGWGEGSLTAIEISPASLELAGPLGSACLVATGIFENGGVRDLSDEVRWTVEPAGVIRIDDAGFVAPLADGVAQIVASAGDRAAAIDIRVRDFAVEPRLNFANDVVPIFSKHSCNSGGCHGKSGGQNGFQLSLFGFDASVDYDALVRQSRGRRLFPASPEHSLLLRKASGALPHAGGARIELESPDYDTLRRWMRSGMSWGSPDDPQMTSIRVFPPARILPPGEIQQLRVEAEFSDGHVEDVTRLAQFEAGDASFVVVDERGRVLARDLAGSTAVLVRYRGSIAVFRATIPSGLDATQFAFPGPRGFVDEHVFARLRRLGIPPSARADDTEFLRRVSIAICGTLPSVSGVREFLGDEREDKRARLIDRLLESSEYSRYFALFWADVLRNRRGDQRAAPLTIRFHHWIRESLAAGRPYDEFVRAIICAEGRITDNPTVAWYRALPDAKSLIDDTAQVFLGTRIQCARCHHHPHERWSQDDYWRFASFFSRVRRRNQPDDRDFIVSLQRGESRLTDDEPTSASYRRTYVGLRALGGGDVAPSEDEDPRHELVDWMAAPDNPYFARAVVNRYWRHFFGRGIVEPEDDIRASNPPSNPELLDALAADFTASGFDLRHLIRVICNSAAYQLSSAPNDHNARDVQNFSRYQPRRLGAEVLLDAIDSALGTTTNFGGTRIGARAIDLPDESSRNYFLDLFGKPERTTSCACERSEDVTLSQVLHLLSSDSVQRKVASDEAPPARFMRDEREDARELEDLFLACFARVPSDDETRRAIEYLDAQSAGSGGDGARRRAWEDITWALLNTKEFLFQR